MWIYLINLSICSILVCDINLHSTYLTSIPDENFSNPFHAYLLCFLHVCIYLIVHSFCSQPRYLPFWIISLLPAYLYLMWSNLSTMRDCAHCLYRRLGSVNYFLSICTRMGFVCLPFTHIELCFYDGFILINTISFISLNLNCLIGLVSSMGIE